MANIYFVILIFVCYEHYPFNKHNNNSERIFLIMLSRGITKDCNTFNYVNYYSSDKNSKAAVNISVVESNDTLS